MQKEVVSGICLETRTVTFFTYDADVQGSYYGCANCNKIVTPAYHVVAPSDELTRQLLDYWHGGNSSGDLDIPDDDDEDEDEEWRCYDLH